MQPTIATRLNIPNFFQFEVKPQSKRLIYLRPQQHSLAIMQPYLFPYLGYFHLIEATNEIVFYDDVNYTKKGFINRNNILLNGKAHRFSIPIEKASQNKLINESYPKMDDKYLRKFFETLEVAYKKAPFYEEVLEMIEDVFDSGYDTIADMAIFSIVKTYEYLGKDIKYLRSSICSPETQGIEKADRLIRITKKLGYENYINAAGGRDIYTKEQFDKKGIQLSFIQSKWSEYLQYDNEFVSGLSIIDLLMFNSPESVMEHLEEYSLI